MLFENQGRASKNKAVDLEDMKFHQCVRLTRFENDRTISFIPPDGAFDLMCAPAGSPGSAQSKHEGLAYAWYRCLEVCSRGSCCYTCHADPLNVVKVPLSLVCAVVTTYQHSAQSMVSHAFMQMLTERV